MRVSILFLIFLLSCSNASDNQDLKIQRIDKIVNDYSSLIHRVATDTTYLNGDTIYKHFEYGKPIKLLSVYIEETATNNKYISYISNDSLIKIVIHKRDPNYASDEAAAYYIDNDKVIKKVETRGKLEDIQKFFVDQKKNINFFKDTIIKHL